MEQPQEEDLSGAVQTVSYIVTMGASGRSSMGLPVVMMRRRKQVGLTLWGGMWFAGHVVPTKDTLISIANWNVRGPMQPLPPGLTKQPTGQLPPRFDRRGCR